MFDLVTATSATERDFAAIIDRLGRIAPADWDREVRCDGWTVRELARHVVSASRGQALGLRRAAAGDTELATLEPPSEHTTDDLMAALRSGRDGLLAQLRELPESVLAGLVPLPFGLLPAPVALQIVPLEYGFHRNDLSWALDGDEPLGPDMAGTLLEIVPGLLPMMAGGTPVGAPGVPPSAPCAFVLEATSNAWLVGYDGQAWSFAPYDGSAGGACVVHGDDSALALFVMGRIPADHPSLKVSDLALAQQFKAFFPGP